MRTLDLEQWRKVPIPEFQHYEVSSLGRVRSPRKVLRCTANNGGYRQATLYNKGRRKFVKVHRLVLEAFVGPRPPNHDACHGNGDRADNRLCNLRWDTRKANVEDSRAHGTMKTKLIEEQVREILKDSRPNTTLASLYGVSDTLISMIRKGKRWAHLQR